MKYSAKKYIYELGNRLPSLKDVLPSITAAVEEIITCYRRGGKLLVCGNGGSAADAMHIVGELMKGFRLPRRLPDKMCSSIRGICKDGDYLCDNLQQALPAISLVNEVSLMTACANDAAPDLVFAQQVLGYAQEGDVLLAISTSGNSANVLYACEVAGCLKMKVIALTGKNGGRLKDTAHILINVPETETALIQELHLPVYHALCAAVEEEMFGEGQ